MRILAQKMVAWPASNQKWRLPRTGIWKPTHYLRKVLETWVFPGCVQSPSCLGTEGQHKTSVALLMRRLRKCCKHGSHNWCVTYALPWGDNLWQQLQCTEFQLGVSPYILNVCLGYSIHSITAFVLSPWWGRNDVFCVPCPRGLRLCQQETGLEKACLWKLLLPLQSDFRSTSASGK